MTGNFSPLNKLCTPTKLCLSQETQEGLRHMVLGGEGEQRSIQDSFIVCEIAG